jgi:hypothetical protein
MVTVSPTETREYLNVAKVGDPVASFTTLLLTIIIKRNCPHLNFIMPLFDFCYNCFKDTGSYLTCFKWKKIKWICAWKLHTIKAVAVWYIN